MIFAVGLDRQIILTAKFSRSMVHIHVFFIAAHTNKQRQGQIQRLKKGAYKKSGGWCAAVVCACIAHSVVGVGRNLDHMRVLLRPSETAITMQLYGNWSATQPSHRFSDPLSFGIISTATKTISWELQI